MMIMIFVLQVSKLSQETLCNFWNIFFFSLNTATICFVIQGGSSTLRVSLSYGIKLLIHCDFTKARHLTLFLNEIPVNCFHFHYLLLFCCHCY